MSEATPQADSVTKVAEAMRAKREEMIARPLASIWPDLARAAVAAMPGWLPIKEAPKDGTILLGIREGRVALIWWDADKCASNPKPYWAGSDVDTWGVRWARKRCPILFMRIPFPLPPEVA